MYNTNVSDAMIPVKRLQLNAKTGDLQEVPKQHLFLKGPIPMQWLSEVANYPGKTLNVAIALCWLDGMVNGQPFKLTQKAVKMMHINRDAQRAGLSRLEQAGLITVTRKPGQRPMISIIKNPKN